MKNFSRFKTTLRVAGIIALAAVIGFSMAACGGDDGGGDPDLSGTITISPNSGVTVGTQLTATYSGGTETVTYQWKRGSTDVGTGTTYTPDQAGSYTVTVSAAGYKSKTSTAVTVTTGSSGGKVATPTATPAPASGAVTLEVPSGTTITLATATQGAEIWYTTNDNPPAKNGATSTKYTGPIGFASGSSNLNLKAIAVKDGMTDSDIFYALYTIQGSGGGGSEGSINSRYYTGLTFEYGNATVTANSITYYDSGNKTIPNAGTGGGGTYTMPMTQGYWDYVFSGDTKIGIVVANITSVMGVNATTVDFYFGESAESGVLIINAGGNISKNPSTEGIDKTYKGHIRGKNN